MNKDTESETVRETARDNIEILTADDEGAPKLRILDNREPVSAQGPNRESPDPHDPATWRVDPSYLKQPVAKKILTRVPVGPPNNQDFIRVHPDESYRLSPAAFIKRKVDGEFFLIHPNIMEEVDRKEFFYATLFLYVNKQKVPALWPIRLPDEDGKLNSWHESAGEAVKVAMTSWIRVVGNKSAGGYDVIQALANYADPEWPNLTLYELLDIAFKNHLVDKLDHPLLLALRGEA